MKILMMTNTYYPIVGGLERSIYSFSEYFRSLGHEVLIATPAFGEMPAEEPGIIRIPAIRNFAGTVYSVNFPVSTLVTRYMREFAPDIVHSHCPYFMGGYALRISRRYAIPLVFTYHTMFEHYVHCGPLLNAGVKRFLIKSAAGYANLADQVIVPSASVQAILLRRGVTSPITVVATGVDAARFANGNGRAFREHNKIPAAALVLGHAGRLAPEKNLDFLTGCLVEALRQDARIHALIVGHGPAEDMIRDAFALAGLRERLHFTGILQRQQLVDAYAAMDVFAFASLSETQGLVLIEAMAAGLPVVALDAPGVREVVVDRRNGRLLKAQERQSFVAALLWALGQAPEDIHALKQAARATAREYPIDSAAKHTLAIYEKLAASHALSPGKKSAAPHAFRLAMKAEWAACRNYLKAAVSAVFAGKYQEPEPG